MDEILICQLPPAAQQRGAVCKWPASQVTWTVEGDLPGFTREQLRVIYQKAWTIWEKICGIRSTYVDTNAMVRMGSGRIDGPSNVLAWSEMPCDLTIRSVLQRFDTGERWVDSETPVPGSIDLVTVAAHELGHALGIPHIERGNILFAAYTGARRLPGPGDVRESTLRYPVVPADPGDPGGEKLPAWFVSLLRRTIAFLQSLLEPKSMNPQTIPPRDWWKLFIAAVMEILRWLAERPVRIKLILTTLEHLAQEESTKNCGERS